MMELQTAWGWQAALYLFLGGLGASMFMVATALDFVQRKRHKRTIALCFWIAFGCVAAGLALLLFELIHPGRALLMTRSFSHASSWMTWGAWALLITLVVFFCTACFATKGVSRLLEKFWGEYAGLRRSLRRVFSLVGCVLATFVVIYTAMLLMAAPGIPFWNSWLLPCLFMISALSAGMNTVALVAILMGSARKLPRIHRRVLSLVVMGLVVLEAVVLAAYLITMMQGGGGDQVAYRAAAVASAQMLVTGDFALFFWILVVMGGLGMPFIAGLVSFFVKARMGWRLVAIAAACTLVSECVLRTLILYAGMQADYIGQAIATML